MQEPLKAGPPQTGAASNGTRPPQQPQFASRSPLPDHFIGSNLKIDGHGGYPDRYYTIEGQLSKGGMGTVYLAHDTDTGLRVAIKLTPPLPSDVYIGGDVTAQRFLREARALKSIDHPNVVKIYNCGKVADRLYIVMEYVDGTPLSKRLDEGYIPWSQAKNIILQTCDGLAAAHNIKPNNIVHRDIKPSNIMLKMLGRNKLHTTLIDFGAVKFQDSKTITLSGTVIGTLFYASPEQIDGKEIDHRSDIYSLGAVMYELVAGTRPFNSSTITTLIKQIVKDTPSMPSVFRPGTPRALDRIIMKALEKNPDKRFQSMEEFAGAIRNCKWDGKLPPVSKRRPPLISPHDAETDTLPRPPDSVMFEAHITQDAYPGVIQTADDVEVKQKGPGRTRVALIAGATALLLGVGIFGVSHFHSARPPLTTRPPLAEPAYPVIKVIKSQPLPPPSDASLDSLFSAEKKSAPASVHKVVPPHHVKHPKTVKKAPKMATVQPNAVVQKKDTVAVQPKAQPTAKDTLVKTHKGPKTLVELINELRQHNKEKKENAAKNAKK